MNWDKNCHLDLSLEIQMVSQMVKPMGQQWESYLVYLKVTRMVILMVHQMETARVTCWDCCLVQRMASMTD